MSKRVFDIVISLLALLVLAPFLLAIALLVKLNSRGPVFYRGVRVGKGGKSFRIFKFRTMVVNAEQLGASSTAGDDPRITSIGGILRRGKLDEFPQLLNVLKGEMSFVGPRPQVQWVVDGYSEEEKLVLQVRPGITDYASLRFANEADILRGCKDADQAYFERIHPEKMRLALEYVGHHSMLIDIKIIFRTVYAVLFGNKWAAPVPSDSAAQAATNAPR